MFGFSKNERLLKRGDFLRLSASAHKLHTPSFLILWAVGPEGRKRIGITASRKVGVAVVRNRIKRFVREYFRTHKTLFPPFDYNVIAKKGAEKLDYQRVCQELDGAVERLKSIQC